MLFKLLTAPIDLPIAGFRSLLELLQDMAERELYDVDRLREQLLLLQLRLEEGEIGEEEYAREEEEIMAQLRVARARRKAQAEADALARVTAEVELVDRSR